MNTIENNVFLGIGKSLIFGEDIQFPQEPMCAALYYGDYPNFIELPRSCGYRRVILNSRKYYYPYIVVGGTTQYYYYSFYDNSFFNVFFPRFTQDFNEPITAIGFFKTIYDTDWPELFLQIPTKYRINSVAIGDYISAAFHKVMNGHGFPAQTPKNQIFSSTYTPNWTEVNSNIVYTGVGVIVKAFLFCNPYFSYPAPAPFRGKATINFSDSIKALPMNVTPLADNSVWELLPLEIKEISDREVLSGIPGINYVDHLHYPIIDTEQEMKITYLVQTFINKIPLGTASAITSYSNIIYNLGSQDIFNPRNFFYNAGYYPRTNVPYSFVDGTCFVNASTATNGVILEPGKQKISFWIPIHPLFEEI